MAFALPANVSFVHREIDMSPVQGFGGSCLAAIARVIDSPALPHEGTMRMDDCTLVSHQLGPSYLDSAMTG